jgi:hypothetical protein
MYIGVRGKVKSTIWYDRLLSHYEESTHYLESYDFDKTYQSSVIASNLINKSFSESSCEIQFEAVDIIAKTHLILATCCMEKGCINCAEKYLLGAITSLKLINKSNEFSLTVRSRAGQSVVRISEKVVDFYTEKKMYKELSLFKTSEDFKKYNFILIQ